MTSGAANVRPTWTSTADLTAKARIRNAALELHAAKGEANTTVREVAQAALAVRADVPGRWCLPADTEPGHSRA
jgi:hypothetical protein